MDSVVPSRLKSFLLALVSLLLVTGMAQAAEGDAEDDQKVSYKLTTGLYQLTGGGLPSGPALDVNLRASSDFGNVWAGWYRSPVLGFSQTRAGWDRTFSLGVVRFMPALELASGGFRGGSAALEVGSDWYAGAGLSRTNLRNYANLNFDPGDAWSLSGGYRWGDNHSLGLQLVRDNRLNPDQQHLHLVFRTPLADNRRLTLDLLSKKGLVAGVPIHRFGLSVGYDWPTYFVRLAWDPKVNFTPQDMVRLSAGVRF